MFTEKMMEDAISNDPEKYLGEKGLKLIKRQFSIGECRYDLLFEDRYGGKLIVELQKGTLNREHFLRIMYYQLEYRVKYPDEFTDLWVIANRIPFDKRSKLDSLGIKWMEISESEFKKIPDEDFLGIKDNEPKEFNESLDAKTTLNEIKITDKGIFKDKFKKSLESCDESIQNLFYAIINEFREIRQASTDKPDYRFYKKNIFCELVMQPRRRFI
jgi:hypothetical protein